MVFEFQQLNLYDDDDDDDDDDNNKVMVFAVFIIIIIIMDYNLTSSGEFQYVPLFLHRPYGFLQNTVEEQTVPFYCYFVVWVYWLRTWHPESDYPQKEVLYIDRNQPHYH